MADFNELIAVSFSELETTLFEGLAKLFLEAMTQVLEKLDAELAAKRDRQRYIVRELKETGFETKLGPVRFRRRVYLDRQTGERIYGLDEALGLTKRARVSPGLKQAAVREAVEGVSYRAARDNLARTCGQPVMSHETVRQLTLRTGKEIQRADETLVLDPKGERKVAVLFIEADGLYVSRQKIGKREERFVIAHEGWQRRSPGGKEYELVNKTYVHCDSASDVWEQASRMLFAKYDLSDTVVVINGDRAKWIREGVHYFPKAIYQFDRFHLLRDVKAKLRLALQARKDVRQAIRDGRPQDALDLMRGVKFSDPKAQRELDELRRDLQRCPEAMVDYRARLAEMGLDTAGMRGMGSAESNMNHFARRLRKQGRSWSKEGLKAMICVMIKCFEGTLDHFTQGLADIVERLDAEMLLTGAGRIVKDAVEKASNVTDRTCRVPIREAGRNASHGLSAFMNRLNQARAQQLA